MWSKVSGSDSVWVNTKDLLFPFFSSPSPPPRSLYLHPPPSVTHPPTPPFLHHTPSAHPFPEIYEGNVWIWLALWTRCQTTSERLCWGSRLRGDVFLSSPCSFSPSCTLLFLSLSLSPLLRCWKSPLTDIFLLGCRASWLLLHATTACTRTRSKNLSFPATCPLQIHSHSCILLTGYCTAACVGWGRLWAAEWRWPTDSSNQEWDAEKMKKTQMDRWAWKKRSLHLAFWIQTHVRCCKDLSKWKGKTRGRGNEGLGHTG